MNWDSEVGEPPATMANSSDRSGGILSSRLMVWALAAVAFAVYANTLGHGFVADDYEWVVGNQAIRSLGNIGHFFNTGQLVNRVYRPLPLAWFSLDYAIAGYAPWFYHAENILLHVLVTLLVYRLLHRFGAAAAWLAAALFAVLPVHTEVVANVTSRSELLATLLALLALSCLERPVLAASLVTLAMLAKETAVAVPMLAPVLWWQMPQLSRRRRILTLGALLAGVAVYVFLRLRVHCCVLFPPGFRYAGLDNPLALAVWPERIRTALMILGQNLALCFVPYHLSADYSLAQIPLVRGWLEPRFLLWTALPVAAGAGALAWRRTRPNLFRGLLWFVVAVGPASNLLLPIGTIRAERLLYLPSVGACLVLGELLGVWLAAHRRWALPTIALLLVTLAVVAGERNRVWRSQETWVLANVRDAPQSARAHFQLGSQRLIAGDCAGALPSFRRALDISRLRVGARFYGRLRRSRRREQMTSLSEFTRDEQGISTPQVSVR